MKRKRKNNTLTRQEAGQMAASAFVMSLFEAESEVGSIPIFYPFSAQNLFKLTPYHQSLLVSKLARPISFTFPHTTAHTRTQITTTNQSCLNSSHAIITTFPNTDSSVHCQPAKLEQLLTRYSCHSCISDNHHPLPLLSPFNLPFVK